MKCHQKDIGKDGIWKIKIERNESIVLCELQQNTLRMSLVKQKQGASMKQTNKYSLLWT